LLVRIICRFDRFRILRVPSPRLDRAARRVEMDSGVRGRDVHGEEDAQGEECRQDPSTDECSAI